VHTDFIVNGVIELMSFRRVLLLLFCSVMMMAPARAQGTTETEAQAFREAAQNRTAYVLPPEKLKLAKELFRTRTTLHFLGEGWGILQLVLLRGCGMLLKG